MFIVLLHYVKALTVVEEHLEEHRNFLDRHYAAGRFLASGAQVPRIGGFILTNKLSREELNVVLNEDPFYREKIATYQLIECNPNKCAPGAEEFFSLVPGLKKT